MSSFDSSLKLLPASVASAPDTRTRTGTIDPIAVSSMLRDGIDPYRIGGALLLCVVLGTVVMLALRRYGFARLGGSASPSTRKRLTIVETARLAPRATLHLIEYDNRRVLVVLHANGVSLLDAHTRPSSETAS
ncbi:TPA: flagellar biosynthetic protein FliO [Burkholderia cenocepacia]|uniref:flagellar biosynthetic protein FliO n=1 Tax=unclassified Burkholderia TaxID=2613784 RepID=UPI00158CC9E2|nr:MULTISPECIES: flagellar biosynthetic protein FliO [unclassified Burkholderia]HEF5875106.1 flagellar biosynthetic protein FliO [Burkholderia cenocepacia]